jgi:hypothetical protein
VLTVSAALLCGVAPAQAQAQDPSAAPAGPAAASGPQAAFGVLAGRWVRPDGGYVISIKAVDAAGKVDASYANPSPLPFYTAEATRDGSGLKLFFELRAGGYDGSTYMLHYDSASDELRAQERVLPGGRQAEVRGGLRPREVAPVANNEMGKTMMRDRPLCSGLTMLTAWAALLCTALPATAQEKKPNVVFILADNVGYGDLGPYGGGELRGAPTPRIDQMAREGLRLTQFLVEPACTPSRAALMTGQYSIRSGLSLIIAPGATNTLPARAVTMSRMFKDTGYATAIFGKWHLGKEPQSLPTAHGFDEYYGIPPDTSWDSSTYVDTIGLTHSINAPLNALLAKGPQIVEAVAGGPLRIVKPFHAGGQGRDRRRAGGEVDRLHGAADCDREAFFPLPAVFDGTRAEPPVEAVRGHASANTATS